MHRYVLLALLCVSVGATTAAADEGPAPPDFSQATMSARVEMLRAGIGSRIRVDLKGNTALVGRVLTVEESGQVSLVMKVTGEQQARVIPVSALVSVEWLETADTSDASDLPEKDDASLAPPPAPVEVGMELDHLFDEPQRVTLASGRVYAGDVVQITVSVLKLDIGDGVIVELQRADVIEVEAAEWAVPGEDEWAAEVPDAEGHPVDPNRTRYLFAPSAMMLSPGEGYFSQKQLLYSEVGFSVSDYFSMAVGSVVPAWFAPDAFNLSIAVKFGFPVSEHLHWSVETFAVVLPNVDGEALIGGGIAATTLTVGHADMHGSISVGAPFVFDADEGFFDPVIVLAGNARLSEDIALVTEHWFIPTLLAEDDDLPGLISLLAVRFIGKRVAVDVGAMHVLGMPAEFPLFPWLDFTYNWGI